jgi:type II secretory pathway pseudopilin PulG
MSLPVLVAIVILGIALSVAAVHFTGGSKTATLAGADQARSRLAEDFPDEIATVVRLTADARTAFLDLGHGRTGIVHGIGDCFLTRIVTPGDVAALIESDGNTVSFRLADFTWKGGRFRFASATDARALLKALEPGQLNSTREAA